jgi:hypothetical protein
MLDNKKDYAEKKCTYAEKKKHRYQCTLIKKENYKLVKLAVRNLVVR